MPTSVSQFLIHLGIHFAEECSHEKEAYTIPFVSKKKKIDDSENSKARFLNDLMVKGQWEDEFVL